MLRGPFKFRGIVIMWSCISSYFIYSDGLFLYYLVYLSLPLYLLSLVFSSTSLRSPSIISSIHIFVFNLFRTLLLCPLKSFWLSYSVSQSKFQSSRFFYAYSLSLSLSFSFSLSISLPRKRFLVVCHTLFLSPFFYQYSRHYYLVPQTSTNLIFRSYFISLHAFVYLSQSLWNLILAIPFFLSFVTSYYFLFFETNSLCRYLSFSFSHLSIALYF